MCHGKTIRGEPARVAVGGQQQLTPIGIEQRAAVTHAGGGDAQDRLRRGLCPLQHFAHHLAQHGPGRRRVEAHVPGRLPVVVEIDVIEGRTTEVEIVVPGS